MTWLDRLGRVWRRLLPERSLARRGEWAAAWYLRLHGYRIVARNARWKGGELDIVARDGELHGIITDGDLRRAIAKGTDFLTRPCDEIMTRSPVTVGESEMFAEAEAMMMQRKINSLLVVDGSGVLAGVLQIYDMNGREKRDPGHRE